MFQVYGQNKNESIKSDTSRCISKELTTSSKEINLSPYHLPGHAELISYLLSKANNI